MSYSFSSIFSLIALNGLKEGIELKGISLLTGWLWLKCYAISAVLYII